MAIVLYDQEEVFRSYIECEKHDNQIEMAKRLLKLGKLTIEEIATGTDLMVNEVKELADFHLT